jgi:hypothetical protein
MAIYPGSTASLASPPLWKVRFQLPYAALSLGSDLFLKFLDFFILFFSNQICPLQEAPTPHTPHHRDLGFLRSALPSIATLSNHRTLEHVLHALASRSYLRVRVPYAPTRGQRKATRDSYLYLPLLLSASCGDSGLRWHVVFTRWQATAAPPDANVLFHYFTCFL